MKLRNAPAAVGSSRDVTLHASWFFIVCVWGWGDSLQHSWDSHSHTPDKMEPEAQDCWKRERGWEGNLNAFPQLLSPRLREESRQQPKWYKMNRSRILRSKHNMDLLVRSAVCSLGELQPPTWNGVFHSLWSYHTFCRQAGWQGRTAFQAIDLSSVASNTVLLR